MPIPDLKSRFCPSPTGLMHLGNARTALFNALLAKGATIKKGKGIFLLRVEDTDATRSSDEYAKYLQEDLHWLGIDWQEGPYFQSQRHAIYAEYYQQLEDAGYAYPCFCSDEQLMLERKKLLSENRPPRYSGVCNALSATEREQKLAQGIKPNLRFRVPNHEQVEFVDSIRGPQQFQTDDIGDFTIRRADGTASFLFSNAVDDALMQVTQVLRGEDHLTNTPRQLLILKALKLPIPQYAHIALIVGDDGSPLSKRHGSRSLREMHEEGFLPIALVNYMARLGHHYEQHPNNLLSFDELAADFSLQALSVSPAKFDPQQLLYWQKQAVAHLSAEEILTWMGQPTQSLLQEGQAMAFVEFISKNIAFPAEALHWAQVVNEDELHYATAQKEVLHAAGTKFFTTALSLLIEQATVHQQAVNFLTWSDAVKNELNVKGKQLFMPLRVALTGEEHGPELADLCKLLGPSGLQWMRRRLEQAIDAIAIEQAAGKY